MALGPTCIPTIREEVVRLQQADLLHPAEASLLADEAGRRRDQKTGARNSPVARHPWRHRHWPARAAHTH